MIFYIEKEIINFLEVQKILKKYSKSKNLQILEIDNYKNLFDKKIS
jgi:hypothetical protein